jgi:ubiquinone/menaquinone biosynthesis C-methylase UbiE
VARDFYASPFGAAYSAYMERPRLSRLVGRLLWGGDTAAYYESMGSIGEAPAGSTVVDCPCGAGPALRAVRPDGDVRYIAADLSPSMLRRARRRAAARGLGVEFLEANATDLPLPAASADLFLSYWGLHCFDDPAAALAEAARLLKPGGRLVACCFVSGRDGWRQRLLVRPANGGFGRRVGTQHEVETWLAAAGFDTASSQRSGPMFFFEARKA